MVLQIFSVPDAFLLSFFSDWLTLKDVANIDTSFCCRQRKWFLKLLNDLRHNNVCRNLTNERLSYKFYRWIFIRDIQLKRLNFSFEFLCEQSDVKYRNLLHFPIKRIFVECINIYDCRQKLIGVSEHAFDDESEFIKIINSCPKLRTLIFTSLGVILVI